MHLLQTGVDLATMALWLDHSSPEITHQYPETDFAAKEAALEHLAEAGQVPMRFRPDDSLLGFLNGL